MKKVIFFMIDSLMPQILEECIHRRLVPALQFFKENGMYWPECTSVFPTMTASVDCSLITGEYPDKHRIPALIWYKPEEKRLVNYTNGALPVFRLGFGNCIRDVLYNLNEKHLNQRVTTIYDELAGLGKTAASINLIAHRGPRKHQVKLPFLIRWLTNFPHLEEVSGPDVLTLGAFVRSVIDPPLPRGWDETLFRHYGINDAFAVRVLNHLIVHGKLPDFTMVYLPDNDHQVHLAPRKACKTLKKVDKQLQKVLNQFKNWEEALEKYIFIITGDHGQTLIGNSKEHNIGLEDLLSGLRINVYGETPTAMDDLVIANNERMTYIYPLKPAVREEVVYRLGKDNRIDIIAWKEDEWVEVRSGVHPGSCRFRKHGNSPDIYGQTWTIEGDLQVLDLDMAQDGVIQFGDYPDVLSRLYGALFSQEIPMIACTAKPGYEFKSAYAPTHLNGGSHGSLHRTDSTIPLIISGAKANNPPFDFPRLVDLKKYILDLLR